jgi:hypothetical protein
MPTPDTKLSDLQDMTLGEFVGLLTQIIQHAGQTQKPKPPAAAPQPAPIPDDNEPKGQRAL